MNHETVQGLVFAVGVLAMVALWVVQAPRQRGGGGRFWQRCAWCGERHAEWDRKRKVWRCANCRMEDEVR